MFRDEARDPARTIPRATYLALLLIGGFYALSSWAMVSAWGDAGRGRGGRRQPGGMLTETADRYVGSVAGDLVQVLLDHEPFRRAAVVPQRAVPATSSRSATPRRCRERCGRSHTRHASPHVASAVQTVSALVLVVASALAGLDPVTQVFAWFVGIPSVGIVALMTLTSAAVVVYFRRTQGRHPAVAHARSRPASAWSAWRSCS